MGAVESSSLESIGSLSASLERIEEVTITFGITMIYHITPKNDHLMHFRSATWPLSAVMQSFEC